MSRGYTFDGAIKTLPFDNRVYVCIFLRAVRSNIISVSSLITVQTKLQPVFIYDGSRSAHFCSIDLFKASVPKYQLSLLNCPSIFVSGVQMDTLLFSSLFSRSFEHAGLFNLFKVSFVFRDCTVAFLIVKVLPEG